MTLVDCERGTIETHLPNAFDVPGEANAWTNGDTPIFARSAAQSFAACCAGVGVANAATGASAKAVTMRIMIFVFISNHPWVAVSSVDYVLSNPGPITRDIRAVIT